MNNFHSFIFSITDFDASPPDEPLTVLFHLAQSISDEAASELDTLLLDDPEVTGECLVEEITPSRTDYTHTYSLEPYVLPAVLLHIAQWSQRWGTITHIHEVIAL